MNTITRTILAVLLTFIATMLFVVGCAPKPANGSTGESPIRYEHKRHVDGVLVYRIYDTQRKATCYIARRTESYNAVGVAISCLN